MMRLVSAIALSLGTLIFLGITGLWVRSYWVADSVHWSDLARDHCVGSSGGRLFYLKADWPNPRVEVPLRHSATSRNGTMPWWDNVEQLIGLKERWLVVRRLSGINPYPQGQMTVWFFLPAWDVWWMPYWPVVLISAVAPAAGVLGWWKKRRRARRGLCRECGYDLRESRGRCPECGTVFGGGRGAEAGAVAHGGHRV